jgi:hypothetical protein
MDVNDVERVAQELKDLHLIEQSREVKPNAGVYCNFSAGDTITFDPSSIDSMGEGAIIWLLLHEEAHLLFHQKRMERTLPRFIVYFVITFLLMGGFSFLKIIPTSNPVYPSLIMVGMFFVVWLSIATIDKRLFFQRYTKPFYTDEFNSDEYGLLGLFIARPQLIGWQEAYSALESLHECRKKRKTPSLLQRIKHKITSYPHPPIGERSRHLKVIFEKYQRIRGLQSTPT